MKRSILFLTAWIFVSSCQPVPPAPPPTVDVLYYSDPESPLRAHDVAVMNWVKEKTKNEATVRFFEFSNDAYDKQISEMVRSKKLPEILFLWPRGRGESLTSSGLLADLKTVVPANELSAFIPSALDVRKQASGKLTVLPSSVTATGILYVNVGLLNKLGLKPAATYEELKAQIPILKKAGAEVLLMANRDDWVLQNTLFSTVLGRYAGVHFLSDFKSGSTHFTDDEFTKALTQLKAFFADSVVSPSTFQVGYGEAPRMFAEGKAAYYFDGDWRVGAFLTDPASGTALIPVSRQNEFALGFLPQLPGQIEQAPETAVSVGSGFALRGGIEARSALEKSALAVLTALESSEVQTLRLKAGTAFPTRKSVRAPELEPLVQARAQLYEKIANASEVVDATFDQPFYQAFNQGLREFVEGKKTALQFEQEMQELGVSRR